MAQTAEHKSPNYMAIFWWLAALTVVEIAVILPGFPKIIVGTLLVALAISKASLVAMYFMHLRFETRTLGYIAVTPLAIGTLLLLVLMPDNQAVDHRTSDAVKIEAPKP
jgi:cytochrome c oxidase subunit IV